MKIIQHVHVGDILQRSVVAYDDGAKFLRVARFVSKTGELVPYQIPNGHAWFAEMGNGKWTEVASHCVSALEGKFVAALMAARLPAPEKAANGTRFFLSHNRDRVFRFAAGQQLGTAYFPNRNGTPDFWSLDDMAAFVKAGRLHEVSYTVAHCAVPCVPA